MLEIRALSKRYQTADEEVVALDDLSLRVRRGEFVAIVGRSGSGKTTLLNMIGGLDIPDSGSILLDGVDVARLSAAKTAVLRRRKVGIIYQFYNLIPELTVRENIILPTELDAAAVDEDWLAEILRIVGLSDRAQAYPNTLSGGQQQRVAIARALFAKPAILLADEPTGNLDGENSREVLGLLQMMKEQYGITVLIVTHSDAVAAAADRVITVCGGRITDDRRR